MKSHTRVSVFLFMITSLLAGCLGGITQSPTPVPEVLYTQAAQTVIAQITQTALAASPTQGALPATSTPEATQAPLPSDTPLPSATPQPTDNQQATATRAGETTPTAEVLFEDDFSDETGWDTQEGDRFGFGFADGGYRIYVNILSAAIWSVRDGDESDVRLEVDASQTGGPADGYYGLVCRHQDEDNYYALVISSNGSFGIAKMENGEFEFLEEGTATEGVIKPGDETNHVRADCVGENLSLYANGQKLLEVQDGDFDSGSAGMVAGTRRQTGVEVLFDNFMILKP